MGAMGVHSRLELFLSKLLQIHTTHLWVVLTKAKERLGSSGAFGMQGAYKIKTRQNLIINHKTIIEIFFMF